MGGCDDVERERADGLPERSKKKKGRTRARVVLATLNMNGAGRRGAGLPEKWLRVNQVIRDRKIAILALQETHLEESDVMEVNELFKATMMVVASPDPMNARGARGVAFAINKRLVDVESVTSWVPKEGRALEIEVRWTRGAKLKVMNVYGPNDVKENAEFWRSLEEGMTRGDWPKPDVLLGDFNVVEAAIDRLPPRQDRNEAVDRLGDLRRTLEMADGMREADPGTRTYTYLQKSSGSQSRIDRIYVKRGMLKHADEWMTEPPGIVTDHSLVCVSIANREAPYMGNGRWMIPKLLLTDEAFLKSVEKMASEAQRELEGFGMRTAQNNPQNVHKRLKEKIVKMARDRAKKQVPKLRRQIEALKEDLKKMVNKKDPLTSEETISAGIVQERVTELELRRFDQQRRAVASRDWVKGETICRYWTRLNVTPLPS
ncbi:Endonuclease/exonuclease/phosphatase, partial [Cerioporus squamosus]